MEDKKNKRKRGRPPKKSLQHDGTRNEAFFRQAVMDIGLARSREIIDEIERAVRDLG
jgi:hypothetical protein